jgi:hypothetical protein
MTLSRFWVLPLLVACSFAACSEPDSASSSAGAGGESPSAAGASSAGDSGVVDGAGEGPVGSPGGASTGGAEGMAGQMAAGGSPGAGGEPGVSVCVPPPVAPVSGSQCPAACEGELIAYEDCDGEGFLQVACATDWFVIQQACGDHLCQEPAFAGQSCSAGQVCALMQGGAQLPECRAHGCGTGPITCECLGEACPGCTQTGVLDFTCNTCPSGQCP